jgi:hypothetical protein
VTFNWQDFQRLLQKAWHNHFPSAQSVLLISLSSSNQEVLELLMDKAYPYQEAVLLLHVQSWRAKICGHCKRAFVADHKKSKYCSVMQTDGNGGFTTCSKKVIKDTGLRWGRENNWGR